MSTILSDWVDPDSITDSIDIWTRRRRHVFLTSPIYILEKGSCRFSHLQKKASSSPGELGLPPGACLGGRRRNLRLPNLA